METKNGFVTVSNEYLIELENKAKDCESFRGRVDGLEYVIDTIENSLKGRDV